MALRFARKVLRPLKHAALHMRTTSFVPPGHFYSPVPAEADFARALQQVDTEMAGIDIDLAQQSHRLKSIAPLAHVDLSEPRYHADDMFDEVDAAIYRAVLRDTRPTRVVEIGVGFSSVEGYGSDRRPLSLESRRMITIAGR